MFNIGIRFAAPLHTNTDVPLMSEFKLWAFGCAHCSADKAASPSRDSLGSALVDMEADFPVDMGVGLGDFAAGQDFPDDDEGAEVVSQFGALQSIPKEAIYTIGGNHCRAHSVDPTWWFRKYIDPFCQNTADSGRDPMNQPYQITDGTPEYYEVSVGNLRFLMLTDLTRPTTSLRGIDDRPEGGIHYGGDPGGVTSVDQYEWWKDKCEAYKNGSEIVITCTHYMLRETTSYSGDGERSVPGHGPGLNPDMASYLGYIGDEQHKYLFREYMELNPGACAMWLGAHSHLKPGEGVVLHLEKWGCYFVNCAALTLHHGPSEQLIPKSRIFTFTNNSATVDMQAYFHETVGGFDKGMNANVTEITLPKTVLL